MPKTIKLEKVKEKTILTAIKQGKIIIYPTDTIYGIGCDALNTNSVLKLRMIKQRSMEKPFSIIPHSKQWVQRNFDVNKAYISKLPGPFTFILRAKKDRLVSNYVTDNVNILAIRIPDHPFIKLIQKSKTPFITTSVNISGKPPITKVSKIPRKISKHVDIIIDAGELDRKPSTIVDLTGNIARLITR
ncbi:MAG: threonylcarbamoyl-AMP synthase [Nanoarchaeota archaeon]|nr:threonylcarbamoyl-AMP synthase [Nanoarchaeota archaeon]MCG2717334.1 threonylcarbamoyl-AMP synthase [Nanoarchaeota archaeon]